MDISTLTQTACVFAVFGAGALVFRSRGNHRDDEIGDQMWIDRAELLLITATLLCIFVVILPIMLFRQTPERVIVVARGACATAAVLVGGWMLTILAHYRLDVGGDSRDVHDDVSQALAPIVFDSFVLAAIIVFVCSLAK